MSQTLGQTHVIALHCSGGSAGQWQHLKRMLPGHVSLWCPHFIGSTWAGHWSGNHAFTLADGAAAIISIIDAIGRPVHLVGHSYGGAVALRVARLLPIRQAVVIAVGVNLATHPVVWLVLVRAGSAYWPLFGVVEVGAWLGEAALILLCVRCDRAVIGLTALVANTGSCLAGLLLS